MSQFPYVGGPGHVGRTSKLDDTEYSANDVALFLRGEMVLFVESSNVEWAKFYPEHDTLEVSFIPKPPKFEPAVYQVYDISIGEALSFANAKSKGGWFWDNVRIRGTKDGHKKSFARIK